MQWLTQKGMLAAIYNVIILKVDIFLTPMLGQSFRNRFAHRFQGIHMDITARMESNYRIMLCHCYRNACSEHYPVREHCNICSFRSKVKSLSILPKHITLSWILCPCLQDVSLTSMEKSNTARPSQPTDPHFALCISVSLVCYNECVSLTGYITVCVKDI